LKGTKLFELIQSFDEQEWSSFSTYLQTRTSNNSSLLTLYKYLFRRRNNLTSKKMEIEEIRINCFKNIKRKNLQNLMSKLSIEIDQFLIIKEIESDNLELDFRLFMAYNKRGLYHRADLLAERLKKTWSDDKFCDHQRIYKLLQLHHFHFLSNNPIKYSNSEILIDLFKSFNNYKEMLGIYYRSIFEHAKSFNLVLPNIPDFDELLNSFSDFKKAKFYVVCNSLLSIQLEATENDFDVLYQALLDKETSFSNEIKEVIYQKCWQFLLKKVISGSTSYIDKLFSLIEYGIDHNIVTANGTLPTVRFHNYIATACAFEEVIWAKRFKSKYLVLLERNAIESSKLLSAGQIFFAEKKYLECIRILQKCETVALSSKIRIRQLLLCSHFVLYDNYDFIYSVVNNFNNFIYYNKAKLSPKNYHGNLDLVKTIKMYISNEKMKVITEFIEASQFMVFRNRLPTIFAQRKLYEKKLATA